MRSPTWEAASDDSGNPTPRLKTMIENLAKGGVGLIIPGAVYVWGNETSRHRLDTTETNVQSSFTASEASDTSVTFVLVAPLIVEAYSVLRHITTIRLDDAPDSCSVSTSVGKRILSQR
jgi:hypothetical protein